jgi:hypothetical protein
MDRCHRIGQTAPVLVFRLATAHSVEGRMLRRAAQKMALERVVMRKGVFKQVVDGGAVSVGVGVGVCRGGVMAWGGAGLAWGWVQQHVWGWQGMAQVCAAAGEGQQDSTRLRCSVATRACPLPQIHNGGVRFVVEGRLCGERSAANA